MATAADEPTPQQSERAREATTRPGAPTELGNPELRLLRKPPGQPLAVSYARQGSAASSTRANTCCCRRRMPAVGTP